MHRDFAEAVPAKKRIRFPIAAKWDGGPRRERQPAGEPFAEFRGCDGRVRDGENEHTAGVGEQPRVVRPPFLKSTPQVFAARERLAGEKMI